MKYLIICIVAALLVFNIIYVPFLCNKFWELDGFEDKMNNAYSFSDMIEVIGDEDYRPEDTKLIDVLYYFGGLGCVLFIIINAIRNSSGACAFGSLVGIVKSFYILYQIGSGKWYVGGNDAYLTFGFFITFVGFIIMLIASLWEKRNSEVAEETKND